MGVGRKGNQYDSNDCNRARVDDVERVTNGGSCQGSVANYDIPVVDGDVEPTIIDDQLHHRDDNKENVSLDKDHTEAADMYHASGTACESSSDVGITVMTASNSPIHRRLDKYSICVFCMKSYAKVSWHFFTAYSQEKDVQAVFACLSGSTERKLLMMKLSNRGAFAHNCNVLRENKWFSHPIQKTIKTRQYLQLPSM